MQTKAPAVLVRRGSKLFVTDLDLGAFLFLRKIYCADGIKHPDGKFELIFYDRQHRAEKLAVDYVNGAEVPAKAFAHAVRDLKRLINRFNNKAEGHR